MPSRGAGDVQQTVGKPLAAPPRTPQIKAGDCQCIPGKAPCLCSGYVCQSTGRSSHVRDHVRTQHRCVRSHLSAVPVANANADAIGNLQREEPHPKPGAYCAGSGSLQQ